MKSRPRGWGGWLLLGLLAGCGAVLWLQRAWVSEPGWFPERQQRGTALSWERFAGCRLVAYPPNDGDSFKVDTGTGEHVFRLYFVDCPEKQRHPAGGERLADQGAYFGGLGEDEILRAGVAAREFSLKLLRAGDFTVVTRWEKVFDSGRYYGHVLVSGADGKPEDLAEQLVSAGLARIHTMGAEHPGRGTEREVRQRLRQLEESARNGGRGAWENGAKRAGGKRG
jgi:endonuclease YncB( thermonuclease family)